MKSAKPSSELLSRRAQPARQARTNPHRSFDSRGGGSGAGGQTLEQRTEFYPAITHFADAITALPKELVRHFTLLKEVDAKIFSPEETLTELVEVVTTTPFSPRRQTQETRSILGGPPGIANAISSTIDSTISATNDVVAKKDSIETQDSSDPAYDPANIPRRHLFRQTSLTMQDMLVSLDEKNHVLSTAAEALNKQMWRLKDVFPFIEREISEEARHGSLTHWAYTEMRANKPVERLRRDAGPGPQTNGHPVSVDEAAARSESRKQALIAKKGRNHQTESDFDDQDHKHKGESSKRVHGNSKKARAMDPAVGLGISTSSAANGGVPAKRRKVEKPNIAASAMERSISSVFNGIASSSKLKAISPRDTPVPENKKKAKAAAMTNGHARKRTISAISPSIASSPLHSTFADSRAARIPSPALNSRPTASKGRQNSTTSVVENARQRPSISSSIKPKESASSVLDPSNTPGAVADVVSEVRTFEQESILPPKVDQPVETIDEVDLDLRGSSNTMNKRDVLKHEESTVRSEATTPVINTIVTTKSGRASKPSTPALPQFPEPVRSRSARNTLEQATNNKRSHKKGAGQAAQLAAQLADDDAASSMQDDEDVAADEDEPTYCYCNGVSYGEMVGCDSETCTREWFHLGCVGLKVAPKGNAKWYCDDCKENMKSRRFSAR